MTATSIALLQHRAGERREPRRRRRTPSRRARGPCRRARSGARSRSARALMRTASASRSRRSTTITASAASADAVAPADAHRDADVGERERGRIVDAVADHDDRPRRGACADERELVLRRELGVDLVDAGAAADGLGDLAAVAGGHHDLAARRRRAARRPRRARRRAGGRPAGRRRPARRRRPRTPARRPVGARDGAMPRSRSQAALPTVTRRPSTRPSTPWPGRSTTSSGRLSRSPRRSAAWTSASASAVRRDLVDRRGEPQQLVRRRARRARPRDRPRARRASTSRSCRSAPCERAPSRSIAPPSLTTTPARAVRDMPETIAIGAARISGQGVATTSTASARTGSPLSAHAAPASDAA